MAERPRVLIESWFPVDVVGAESMRERGASSALPPLNFLHVWWARRPLLASRAAILASVLPEWSTRWPAKLKMKFSTEESYQAWFLELCGIFGDPVAGRKRIEWAKDREIKLKIPPYSHKRAFTVSPSPEYLETLGDLLEHTWGKRRLSMLDPFAGGGSIPFEAFRYGFAACANELNSVATVILKATLDYPARFGLKLVDEVKKYGRRLDEKVRKRLEPFFPVRPGESIHAYLWARTVPCPYTGKPIPLSPNWWLRKGSAPVSVQPIFNPNSQRAQFRILHAEECSRVDPGRGTTSRKGPISPWANDQGISWDYVRSQGREGNLGQQLYALAVRDTNGLSFRTPSNSDLEATAHATKEFEEKASTLFSSEYLPNEEIPVGKETHDHQYGIRLWTDMFSRRQLLTLGMVLESFAELKQDLMRSEAAPGLAEAILTYLALAVDKAADYNSRMCKWDSTRIKITNTFDRHDFSLKWSYAEFDAANNLLPWVTGQVVDAYVGIANLAEQKRTISTPERLVVAPAILHGSAASLPGLSHRTIDHICVDPPYGDNVMYAECADFFYVWLKRTLEPLHQDLFCAALTNKDEEAVLNEIRFRDFGKSRKKLAKEDYERKMAAAFREMHRVLTDDGVLTVMFTHKKVAAWDTLATSLIGAGFTIHSSWPVHTESEHSLHQAKKNAAKSTILLTCRKRQPNPDPVWWDDLQATVRRVAREKAEEFEAQGIRGVDLYIATFGPTLAILSENWPVLTSQIDERTGEPIPLKPEIALDLAREVVVDLRKQGLLLGRAVQFDPVTDWYLMAWDAFRAEKFPADEARKLAIALGLDLERQVIAEKRLVSKKSADVVLLQPQARRRRGMVDPDLTAFDHWIDAAHTAMLLYAEDGAQAAEQFLRETDLETDSTFKALVQALVNAIPRTRAKGQFVRPEAATLEALRLAFFDDLEVPVEEKPEIPMPVQANLFE